MFGRNDSAPITSVDSFLHEAVGRHPNHLDGFMKAVKYKEAMRNKWTFAEVRSCYKKVREMFREDKKELPVVNCLQAVLLGCLSPKVVDGKFAQDDGSWFIKEFRTVFRKRNSYPSTRAVEACYQGYTDLVHGMVAMLDKLPEQSRHELFDDFMNALELMQNSKKGRLTAAHRPILVLCVQRRLYHLVKDIVNQVIVEVSPGLSALDYLYYFYYAGLVHTALKQFPQALDHYAMCQIVPGESTSMIQIDAHKKYILVSLILHGRILPLPDFVHHRLNKTHQKICRPYLELENAFGESAQDLAQMFQRHSETYMKDENYGLAVQVLKAHEINRVRRLRNVYATCSIQTAAEQAGIEQVGDAKKIVLYLIKIGELNASVDANEVITFHRGKTETQRRYAEYAQNLKAVMELTATAEAMFYDVRKSEEYIKNTTPQLRSDRKEIGDEDLLITT